MKNSVVAFNLYQFNPNYTRIIMGNVSFRYNPTITDLGTLEVILGYAVFDYSQVQNLGKLQTIVGNAYFLV